MPKFKNFGKGISFSAEEINGEKFYRVILNKRFLGEGKNAIQRRFKKKEDAEDFAEAEKKKKEGDPDEAEKLGMTPPNVIDAKYALQRLGGKATLSEAVDSWFQFVAPFKNAPKVSDAITALVKDKKGQGNTPRHVRDLETFLEDVFSKLLDKKISEISSEDLEQARDAQNKNKIGSKTPSASLKRKRLRYAKILINFSISKRWIGTANNPLIGVSITKAEVKPVKVLFVEEVALLLWHTQEFLPDMLPAMAIKIFSGIRNSELYKLQWEWVKKNSIRVPAAYAKTRRNRSISMDKILHTWLSHAKQGKDLKGRVFDLSPDNLDREGVWLENLKHIYTKAGFKSWPQNALRHTFGSYHYQAKKNENLTSFEMGNSPAVVRRHYVDEVDEEQATRFWNLTPGGVERIATSPPVDPFAPPPQLPDEDANKDPKKRKYRFTPEDLEPDEIPVVHPTPTRTPKKIISLPLKQEKKPEVLKPAATTNPKFPVKRRLLEFNPPVGKKTLKKTLKRKK